MSISQQVEKCITKFNERNIEDARYLLLDDQSYFTLKEEVYGSVDAAILVELEDFEGLKVFHNNIGNTFIDVA